MDPLDKEHKHLDTIELKAPRLAQYMRKAWKGHQNTVYFVTYSLLNGKDWSSIKQDRTQSSSATHLVTLQRFLWNMIGWNNWVQKLLENQMEKLFNSPKVHNQANQTQSQIMIERETSLPWALRTNFNVEDERNHDRTEKPVVCRAIRERKITSNQW